MENRRKITLSTNIEAKRKEKYHAIQVGKLTYHTTRSLQSTPL